MVSQSWCRAHCGTFDQILILSEFCCLVSVGRPLWREVGSLSCQSLSAVIVHQVLFLSFFFPPILHFTCFMYIQYIFYLRQSQRLNIGPCITSAKMHRKHCFQQFFIVGCVSMALGTFLPSRCLGTEVFSPSFRLHQPETGRLNRMWPEDLIR
jgi:hypothetical protein